MFIEASKTTPNSGRAFKSAVHCHHQRRARIRTRYVFMIPNASLQRAILPFMRIVSPSIHSLCPDQETHTMRPTGKMKREQIETLIESNKSFYENTAWPSGMPVHEYNLRVCRERETNHQHRATIVAMHVHWHTRTISTSLASILAW